jgi:D-ribose pyranase
MKETGILNRDIAAAISRQGHTDLLMVCDAGFAAPDHIEVIDISLSENKPRVLEMLAELRKYFSVEKIIMAMETREHNPAFFDKAAAAFGDNVEIEAVPHEDVKALSHKVKTIIRTGDFTAWSNVVLVSGAGDRWKMEK